MKSIVLFFISLSIFIGCYSSEITENRFEPEFEGKFVDSEIKINADYRIPEAYYHLNDSTFTSYFAAGYYLAKPFSINISMDSAGFLIKPFPEDTISFIHLNYRFTDDHKTRFITGMKVTFFNNTPDTIIIHNQAGSMIMIQEALSPSGKWEPIEYWTHSFCGNAYGRIIFLPYTSIEVGSPRYKGSFETQLRFKLEFLNEYSNDGKYERKKIYSEQFKGSVNYSQFHKMKIEGFDSYLE